MCYQLYHAQALFKACEFEEAWGAALKVTGDELPFEVLKLQAAIKFNGEELNEARCVRVARPCTATVPYYAIPKKPKKRTRPFPPRLPLFLVGPHSESATPRAARRLYLGGGLLTMLIPAVRPIAASPSQGTGGPMPGGRRGHNGQPGVHHVRRGPV